jgi:aryl-alcohol dehydrogenase-like predicted oxidoreductase
MSQGIWDTTRVQHPTNVFPSDGIPSDSRFGHKSDDHYIKSMQQKFGTEDWENELKKVAALKPIAEKLGTSQGRLAMAWVLKNPHVASAITGASRPEQVYDSVQAIDLLPKLTAEIMKEIDEVLGNKPEPLTKRFG